MFNSGNDRSRYPGARFGATLSHGLKPEEGSILKLRPSIDLPDVIVNGWMIDKKRIKISPLLYNGNLYKIEIEPWIENNQYKHELYNDIVKDYYEEHRKLFEQKHVFVHPNMFLYFSWAPESYNNKCLSALKERIDSLRQKKSGCLIYLATCRCNQHVVTFILTVKKTSQRMFAHCYYFGMDDSYDEWVSLKAMTCGISETIGIPIEYHEMYPKVSLNIEREKPFLHKNYSAVIACIFINFLLQYLLQCATMKEHATMSHILKKVYKTCISMKNIKTGYKKDLWYYVVKNCAAAMFLKHYNLDGTKSLNDQSYRVVDVWSDSLFPENFFDIAEMIRVSNSESEYRHKKLSSYYSQQRLFIFDSEDQLNKNFLKLSYAVANFGCVETLFGIVLYEDDDTTSLIDTLSSAVNDNRVNYYVISLEHYSFMFGTKNERGYSYKDWLHYVTQTKMNILFAPLWGSDKLDSKEILWLTKHGIIKQKRMYTRFHIFGLKKNNFTVNDA